MTMLAACSEDECLDILPAQGITFNTSVGQSSRANVMDLDGLKTAGFTVSAFRYSGTGADKKVSDKVHFDNLSVGWTGSAWANDVRYWPSSSEKTVVGANTYETTGLDFIAYSPTALSQATSVTCANGDMKINDFAPAAACADQNDLSVAYAADQKEEDAGVAGVSLNFKHTLAQVEVKARNYASDLKIDIQNVKICNVVGMGTLTLGATSPTPTWTMGETTAAAIAEHKYATANLTGATLVGTATEATSFHTNGDYFMLLPQTSPVWQNATQTADNAAGAYFLVTCKIYDQEGGNNHYRFGVGTADTWGTVAIPIVANGGANKLKWEAGKKYTYTLEFFKDGGGAGYHEPDGTSDAGKSLAPGQVSFATNINVETWGDGGSFPRSETVIWEGVSETLFWSAWEVFKTNWAEVGIAVGKTINVYVTGEEGAQGDIATSWWSDINTGVYWTEAGINTGVTGNCKLQYTVTTTDILEEQGFAVVGNGFYITKVTLE